MGESEWISVADRLPEPGRIVLVVAVPLGDGKRRRTLAEWIPARWREDYGDSDDLGEYDEERDCYWWRPGWYESGGVVSDEAVAWPLHEVTHWMPLPALPGQPADRRQEGEE